MFICKQLKIYNNNYLQKNKKNEKIIINCRLMFNISFVFTKNYLNIKKLSIIMGNSKSKQDQDAAGDSQEEDDDATEPEQLSYYQMIKHGYNIIIGK